MTTRLKLREPPFCLILENWDHNSHFSPVAALVVRLVVVVRLLIFASFPAFISCLFFAMRSFKSKVLSAVACIVPALAVALPSHGEVARPHNEPLQLGMLHSYILLPLP